MTSKISKNRRKSQFHYFDTSGFEFGGSKFLLSTFLFLLFQVSLKFFLTPLMGRKTDKQFSSNEKREDFEFSIPKFESGVFASLALYPVECNIASSERVAKAPLRLYSCKHWPFVFSIFNERKLVLGLVHVSIYVSGCVTQKVSRQQDPDRMDK